MAGLFARPFSDLRGIGHRHAEVAVVVAMTGIKPGPVQIEHL